MVFRDVPAALQASIDLAVETVREVSMQTDPQEMVRRWRERSRRMIPRDADLSISRRELQSPWYRITRSARWTEAVNPWKQKDRLPLLTGGLLAELIYGNEPRVIDDLKVAPDEPAAEYLEGMRSLIALPLYEDGESLNMVIRLLREPNGFDIAQLPDLIVTSNLFGRATYNLIMAEKVREAYDALDAEFKVIARIQQSLLPSAVPQSRGLDVAAYYATARRAGGDYYDFFPIDENRTGILIADVSGHGAAAAVVMARMHAALHVSCVDMDRPAEVLAFANDHLLMQCRTDLTVTTFVTAFYAVFDSTECCLVYSSAGHNPPRWLRADGSICSISGARDLPLGIICGVRYEQDRLQLQSGDAILLYTDGIVEAFDPAENPFGDERLDEAFLLPHASAQDILDNVLAAVERFAKDTPAFDDRTMLALRVE